jgi:hypothetical protein
MDHDDEYAADTAAFVFVLIVLLLGAVVGVFIGLLAPEIDSW